MQIIFIGFLCNGVLYSVYLKCIIRGAQKTVPMDRTPNWNKLSNLDEKPKRSLFKGQLSPVKPV